MRSANNQPREMRNIAEKVGADLLRDFTERLEIDYARIRSRTGHDNARTFLAREIADDIVIDAMGFAIDTIRNGLPEFTGDTRIPSVREMTAVRQRQSHDDLARLQQPGVHGEVGGRPRVRLHVGVLDAEKLLGALDSERLDLIDVALTLVVAAGGGGPGILVLHE